MEGGAIQVVLEGVSSRFAAEPALGVLEAKPGVSRPAIGPSFKDVEGDHGARRFAMRRVLLCICLFRN